MNQYEKVLSWLGDEESRFIYQQKVAYVETKDFGAIQKIVERYLPESKVLNSDFQEKNDTLFLKNIMVNIGSGGGIALFGAGVRGRHVLDLLRQHGVSVDAIIDNHPEKYIGVSAVWGNKILKPTEYDFHNTYCIITPDKGGDDIFRQLCDLGAEADNVIQYRAYNPIDPLLDKQYFDEKIIHFGAHESFVDAGVFDLGTSKRFIERCKQHHVQSYKVYAFEPEHDNYIICKNVLKELENENIELYNCGLWSKDAVLSFAGGRGGSSAITDGETGTHIQAVALDSCVKDLVTFIKMDIEGAELEALKGAARTIRRDKPKLAISIYHKDEDLTEIPVFVKELVPEYKLYIRHYSNAARETVLYAVT